MNIQPEGIRPTPQPITTTRPEGMPGTGVDTSSGFARMLQAPAGAGVGGAKAPSATELRQQRIPGEAPTAASLNNQVKATSTHLNELATSLNAPGLRMSKADQKLLLKKLPKANEAIRDAAKRVGIDVGAKVVATKDMSLLQKALLYIGDGQSKLTSATNQMARLNFQNMNPAAMIAIQMKLSAADQQIAFCNNLLSGGVSAVKTLMNIQV
jgi:hypothetical protein